jgi:hypothetical protein
VEEFSARDGGVPSIGDKQKGNYASYNLEYKIAADIDWAIRLLKNSKRLKMYIR